MNEDDVQGTAAWLVERGLAGASETELLHGFCERSCQAGLALSRAVVLVDTLHPIYEGRAFRWRNDGVEESAVHEYGSSNEGEAAANWQSSPFYHLLTSGADEIRRRIAQVDSADFPHLDTLKRDGHTDYAALIHRFAGAGAMGEMDCVYSSWTTKHPDGFGDAGMAALRRLVPSLALAIKCASLARIAGTLVEVYLGRDAGRRVLSGRISRGVAEKIRAVLWSSDLRGYTAISDTAPPGEIIPLLNDYADAVISAVHESGGEVLKLIGDGVLAIFRAEDPAEACRRALQAEAALRSLRGETRLRLLPPAGRGQARRRRPRPACAEAAIVTRQEFRQLVDEALETIPEQFRDAMKNIAITPLAMNSHAISDSVHAVTTALTPNRNHKR